ncbi:MAG: hypothetical protein MIO93_03635 [ANME-2 cluster archaeon]|nr:hypothetical protein [ANME-2 cluster archaeon]
MIILDYSLMTQVLHFYSWIVISLLILITGAIGYFYQKKFNIKTNYYLFIIAAVLTLGEFLHFVAIDYVWIEYIQIAGILLASLLTLKLYKAMTGAM